MIYWKIFERNIGAISRGEQEKLAKSTVAIVGLGGIGGMAAEILSRAGIENLVLCDKDKFELSNLNRQIFGDLDVIGKKKIRVVAKKLKKINPEIKMRIFSELNEKNAFKILRGADAVVDGLDNALGRVIVARACRELKIPYVFGSVEKLIGMSTIFFPNDNFEKAFGLKSSEKKLTWKLKENLLKCQTCDSVISVVPNMIGCFEAAQCIKLLLGKKIIKYPKFLFFDISRVNPFFVKNL